MGDVFKEQLVKMKMSQKDKIQRGILYTGSAFIMVTVFIFFGPLLGGIAIVGLGWAAHYFASKFKREHEYVLTNNELDIDVIYNKERRKRLISIDMKKIEVMASIKDEKHKPSFERAQKSINASDGEHTGNTYGILYPEGGQLIKIFITPHPEMLECLYKQAPHKVMKYRG